MPCLPAYRSTHCLRYHPYPRTTPPRCRLLFATDYGDATALERGQERTLPSPTPSILYVQEEGTEDADVSTLDLNATNSVSGPEDWETQANNKVARFSRLYTHIILLHIGSLVKVILKRVVQRLKMANQ